MLDIVSMENKWRDYWKKNNVFKFTKGDKNFSIDTPPPTVSGKMHLGHAYSYPHQDFIARYKRMKGYNVFYPWGFDDNGLPTERYVEKTRNVTIENTPLGDYIEICKEESKKAELELADAWYSIGLSASFNDYIDTSSDFSMKMSQKLFLDLARSGRAYRAEAPYIRCPTCKTAISQIEMKDAIIDTDLVYINFDGIEIATTRPEMLGACVAVFVNPGDERYKNIIGKKIKVPLYGNEVPVMSDESIDMNFGTGAEMLCTFGDQNDLELWRKYNLDSRIILKNDKLNDSRYLDNIGIKEARKRIIEELKKNNYIIKIEKIKHSVNTHERCGTPIEIGISKQWYIKDLDIKKELLEFGDKIEWIPEYMKTRYDNWVNGLRWDWCISRQRYFGIPFPVWYCNKCGTIIYADEKDLPVDPRLVNKNIKCPACGSDDVQPERDVMDTWATSSISPTLYLTHINSMDMYPMDVRFQGHDIITSWAFTTILRSYLHYNKIPWKKIAISGNVYDPFGQKMSKSKGNIVEPKDIIEKYGADALRFWGSTTMPGENIKLREQDLVRGKKTVIKLYNSLNLLKIISGGKIQGDINIIKSPVNKWIMSKYEKTVREVTGYMDAYEVMKARSALDKFFWSNYCDNYLEIIKNDNEEYRNENIAVSYLIMENVLKMYSPIMPFITEELYHEIHPDSISIALEKYPEYDDKYLFNEENDIDYIISVINSIRALKSSLKISMAAPIDSLNITGDSEKIGRYGYIIKNLMHINNIKITSGENININVIQ
ncbi:valine--tRNA ligase [Acidiplasma sp.]|uniref:valine--tRNA ligase n=1 Tax=Acidiplasma sp. TaxID=1872114 RepID=UPI00258BCDB4|nr:valine--tRNA ligase [Acidiplasma sp.]